MSRGTSKGYNPAQSRMVLFGLDNQTTREVLQGLLSHGVRPLAVVLPGSAAPHLFAEDESVAIVPPVDHALSVLAPAQRDHIAEQVWAAGLPLMVVGDLGAAEAVNALANLRAEVGVVACFSRKIPRPVRDLFAAGVLNIHPSLLPDYRGPAPLFWQFRDGKTMLGVTLHQMDGGFDTGPIVGQTAVRFAAGTPEPIAELALAQTGVLLLVDALAELQRGVLVAMPQPPGGSAQGWPTDDDFTIDPTWTVARAYFFVQSTAVWRRPYRIVVNGEVIEFVDVLALAPTVLTDRIVYESEQAAWIPMRDGALRVRLVAAEGNPA